MNTNEVKKKEKILQIITMVIFVVFIAIAIFVFLIFRSFSISYECEKRVAIMQKQNPNIDWNKQVKAPVGFSSEIKTIPLSMAEELKCKKEKNDLFLF